MSLTNQFDHNSLTKNERDSFLKKKRREIKGKLKNVSFLGFWFKLGSW